MTLYEVLGVEPNATAAEIKDAYRKKAQKTHPDRDGGNHEQFQKVQEAYDVLSNPEARARYDTDGTYRHQPQQTREEKLKVMANNVLRNILAHVIDHTKDVEYSNILDILANEVKMLRQKELDSQDELLKRIEKFEKSIKRLKGKDGQENTAALLLRGVVSSLDIKVNEAKENIEIADLVMGMVECHTYDVDEMPDNLAQQRRQEDMIELQKMIAKQFNTRFGG